MDFVWLMIFLFVAGVAITIVFEVAMLALYLLSRLLTYRSKS